MGHAFLRSTAALLLFSMLSLATLPAGAQDRSPAQPGKLTLLNGHLRTIHDEARLVNTLGGASLLAFGAFTTWVGIALFAESEEDGFFSDPALGLTLAITGGLMLGTGLLLLVFPDDAVELPRQWWAQVEDSDDEVLLVRRGEAILEELADDGRVGRYIAAGAFGLAALPGVSVLVLDGLDGLSAGLPSALLWGGLATWMLLSESTAEEELGKYRAATGGAGTAQEGAPPSSRALRWSVAPWVAPQGAGLGAGLVF